MTEDLYRFVMIKRALFNPKSNQMKKSIRWYWFISMKSYSANMFVSLLTVDQEQANPVDRFSSSSSSSRQTTELDLPTRNSDRDEPTETEILPNNDQRETWSTNCDYLITTLGGLIGLGRRTGWFHPWSERGRWVSPEEERRRDRETECPLTWIE